jgi:hypothetical protein
MSRREEARKEFRGRSKRKLPDYPMDIQQQSFNTWFRKAASEDIALGNDASEDILALLLPPRREAKGYKAMYAYGNPIRVRSAEVDMSTCDSGVAATFLQSCRSSSSDRNMRIANLEYVGWVDEIISVDYGKFEVVVLYCTWAQANKRGARATMKCDEYGFTLFRFDRLIPYSADSFAFPLHVQQVFYVDDEDNNGWKIVLRRQPRGARVESSDGGRNDLQSVQLGRVEEHVGLRPEYTTVEREPDTPELRRCRRLTTEDVNQALVASEEDVEVGHDLPSH